MTPTDVAIHDTEYPLFAAYPRLGDRLPRLALGRWPTPVERLPSLTEDAAGTARADTARVWVKREDLSRAEFGGNKWRGLELLLGDALSRGAKTLLTVGAAGSHHVRATALAARETVRGRLRSEVSEPRPSGSGPYETRASASGGPEAALAVEAVLLHQPNAAYVRRNIAIAVDAGATLRPARLPMAPTSLAAAYLRAWRRDGRRPYWIGPGGTSPLACVGHVSAAFELRDQIAAGAMPEPRRLFVAMGSLGTTAGLLLGLRLAGLKTRVVGVAVFSRWYNTAGRCARLARRTNRLMRRLDSSVLDAAVTAADIDVIHDQIGCGYAHFTHAGVDAAGTLGDRAGLTLDGAYTGKCAAAMLESLRRPQSGPHDPILYWHTYAHCTTPSAWRDAEVPRLPRGLRRYFVRDVQPLDAEWPEP